MSFILGVTGHRPNKLRGYSREALDGLALFARHCLETEQPDKVITGMALGWDQAIAIAAVELNIYTIAAVPFKGQERKWPLHAQKLYQSLLEVCEVWYPEETIYSPRLLLERNKTIIDNSDKILALWNGESAGGTAHAVAYARSKGLLVKNVWDEYNIF